ncbi:hypothetical protein QWY99_01580 [Flavobacterium branchiarum]|uniref:DUF3592 domain-containing protein n=1 Tax=Flavobacterium branchiarum TaxID=1114870 RepID=A0ABV5FHB5_9FLAO|nr:hypothetical protein [Flavobacterium branchiarum]MDN3671757.1 hypothetical protein [Flavobacterium branchiarum]
MKKNSTENTFIIKNKPVIIYLLMIVTLFILFCFLDYHILPASKTTDKVTHYTLKNTSSKRRSKPQTISYHYYTQNGFTFSTAKSYIEEKDIELEHSLILKSVRKVKSGDKDYTNILTNDLSINGILFYFCCTLLLSIAISLKILHSKKAFSENTFYNIICFNTFMILVCLYMTYLY